MQQLKYKRCAAFAWNDLSTKDNSILQRVDANNICIHFDEPPFTYFSDAIWAVLLINVLFYELCDMFRTYDADCDVHTSKKCCRYYKITIEIETTIFIYIRTRLAVKPDESMMVHIMPYVVLIDALFLVVMKRFLYFKVTGIADCYGILDIIYILLLLSPIGKSFIVLSNLFGAHMWRIDGLEWTSDCTEIDELLFSFLVLICPFFVYITLNAPLQTITLTINRIHDGIRITAGLKKHIHYMQIQLKEKVHKMATFSDLCTRSLSDGNGSGSGGDDNQDYNDYNDEIKMINKQAVEIGQEIICATLSLCNMKVNTDIREICTKKATISYSFINTSNIILIYVI